MNGGSMSEKIRGEHLQRGAYVYVRQSTPYQVRNHLEGKERQYALDEIAKQLRPSKVIVIDEDLGRSGSGTQERVGFGRLLASVCQGLAGAVFALEASRLARNNRDWHHLVDLCALAETLLIDTDGIYDPRSLNDRLLLGLKGSMAEFELGLLRQRARAAFEQKVRRGFTLWEVPVGFIRTEEGRLEKTPDRQVQQAIATVFQKFHQLGSARQATIWFREEQISLPHVKGGTAGKEVIWALPSSGRLLQMLRNPCYGGAFAYGKTEPRTVIEDNRLGYKTGQEKNWNASRVAGLRGYHHIEPFQKQDGWVTREQAAEELKVSNTVVRRLIREEILPATQVVQCAPWVIDRKDLSLPAVQVQVQAVHNGRRLPPIVPDQAQLPLE